MPSENVPQSPPTFFPQPQASQEADFNSNNNPSPAVGAPPTTEQPDVHPEPAPFATAGVLPAADRTKQREGFGGEEPSLEAQYAAAQQGAAVARGGDVAQGTLQREWDRLRLLEEELHRREKQLRQRELELGKLLPQPPNFPNHCPCIKPQVYHNISADIPAPRVGFIRGLYVNYYYTCFLLIFQAFVAFIGLVAPNKDDKDGPFGEHFGVSLLYLLGICFAFMIWYWPTYQAVSTRVPSKYRMAFLGLCIAFLFDVVMLIGVPGHGGTGLFFAMAVQDKKESGFLEAISIVCAGMWALQVFYLGYAIYRLRKLYNEDLLRSILPGNERVATEVMGTVATLASGGGDSGGGRGGAGRAA